MREQEDGTLVLCVISDKLVTQFEISWDKLTSRYAWERLLLFVS